METWSLIVAKTHSRLLFIYFFLPGHLDYISCLQVRVARWKVSRSEGAWPRNVSQVLSSICVSLLWLHAKEPARPWKPWVEDKEPQYRRSLGFCLCTWNRDAHTSRLFTLDIVCARTKLWLCLSPYTLGFFCYSNKEYLRHLLVHIFLAVPGGLWDLSSPIRDQTQAHGSEIVEL